jgi:hypothetical protein
MPREVTVVDTEAVDITGAAVITGAVMPPQLSAAGVAIVLAVMPAQPIVAVGEHMSRLGRLDRSPRVVPWREDPLSPGVASVPRGSVAGMASADRRAMAQDKPEISSTT